jgi:hypothetical protein
MFFKKQQKKLTVSFVLEDDQINIDIINYNKQDKNKLSVFFYSLNKGLYIQNIVSYLLQKKSDGSFFIDILNDWERVLQIENNSPIINPIDTFSKNAKS